MMRLPQRRLAAYLLVIVALLGLWLAGDAGVLPFNGGSRGGVFQVPAGPEDGAYEGLGSSEKEAARQRTPQGDEFEEALRRLAAEGGGVGEGTPTSETPTPVASATVASDTKDGERDERLAGDDARQIFSGLETPQGSQVEDYGLAGVVSRGAPGALPTPDETPSAERPWASGQARGYTMLYAMQPEARAVVESHVQTLLAARIREMYIGVLIDGFFGPDFTYLRDVIRRLSTEERSLTVALYLSNGATMRKWREKRFDSLFARIDPDEFRQRIRREQLLRAQFLAVAIQARDIFRYNESLSPSNSNIAVVMLEDNLDALAYRSMRDLAVQEIGALADFVRNPCLGCYGGNDDNTLGDPREEHEIQRFNVLTEGDGYSFDGEGFEYPNTVGSGVSAEQLLQTMSGAVDKKLRYVGLWRHEWQGVVKGVPNKLPQVRTYIPPNSDQQLFEIRALRTGLVKETDAEDADAESGALGVQ